MKLSKTLYFKNRKEWRKWLRSNYQIEKEVWLMYYKKHTSKPSVSHKEAVEEALCFGWIDSKVRRIDNERFVQKYTPRKKNSLWSLINKKTAEKMMKKGKMTKAGLEKIEKAKRGGKWSIAYTSKKKLPMPLSLKRALTKDKIAWQNFRNFANTYQNMYIGWVTRAKKEETRKRRIKKIVKLAKQNKKLITL